MTSHLDHMRGYSRRGLLSPTEKVEVAKGEYRVWEDRPRSDSKRIKAAGVFCKLNKIKPWEME